MSSVLGLSVEKRKTLQYGYAVYKAVYKDCRATFFGLYMSRGGKSAVEEAQASTFLHVWLNEDKNYADCSLHNYICKVARGALKNGKELLVPLNTDTGLDLLFKDLGPANVGYVDKAELKKEIQKLDLQFPYLKEIIWKIKEEKRGVPSTSLVCTDKELKKALLGLMHAYDVDVLGVLHRYYASKPEKKVCDWYIEVPLKETRLKYEKGLPDLPMFKVGTELVGLDKASLQMTHNLDMLSWRPISKSQNIYQVDVSAFYDTLMTQIGVPQGVDSAACEWSYDMHCYITPFGRRYVGVTPTYYMQKLKEELLVSFMRAGITSIVGITPDSIYIRAKPTKDIAGKLLLTWNRGEGYTENSVLVPVKCVWNEEKEGLKC